MAGPIAPNTIVVGDATRSMLADLYSAMDVLVHPSLIDNLPTVPIEAGLVGTKCLATDVGGTAESIASTVDLIDPEIEPMAMAYAIRAAIDAAAAETGADRLARRASLLERLGHAEYRPRLEAAIQWIARGAR